MIKRIICCFFLLTALALLQAKELKYPVSEIPAGLKENAHTVMRLNQQEIEIKSAKSLVITVIDVRTILNKRQFHA